MTKEEMKELTNMMMQMFNDGYEQVVIPRLEGLEEKMEEMKQELKEEFKRGQKSLSDRLEAVEVDVREINKKMDKVVEKDEDYGKRLDKVERIVKAN